jgi:hypothetical protein
MNFKIFFIFLIIISSVYNSSIEEVKMGLKEVAYSYYMRGNIFNIMLIEDLFSPQKKQINKILIIYVVLFLLEIFILNY